MNLFWFRRDLRIEDNRAFFEALHSGQQVLPIFIFDSEILGQLENDDSRVSFIHQLLSDINNTLNTVGSSLAVFHGKPKDVIEKLISDNQIQALYANRDYEPYARKRDKEVYDLLQSKDITFKSFKDQVIFEKNEVTKDDGLPYVVYTPYARKWKETLRKSTIQSFDTQLQPGQIAKHKYPFLSLTDIGFLPSKISVSPYKASADLIQNYEATRNFPALASTSLLGPHLRFGSVSIRKILKQALQTKNETFLNELIWREFFMQILWHYPNTTHDSFRQKYDQIQWNNDENDFRKWCEGKTGYPFVDAGLRELNATGNMHNRVRMIVASFLCKHLLIDWRWGESYFAQKLLDYEQASNVGNWQWAAGSGVDAAPYFRIFNPTEQIKKFDKDLIYIRKWIPELNTPEYPEPIVEHTFARERCLRVYKEAVT